eukprot:9470384-Alexandrium_andersonii.AAC.1
MATNSANGCFSGFGRMTWAAASAPGGAPERGRGAVGARLLALWQWARVKFVGREPLRADPSASAGRAKAFRASFRPRGCGGL